jgi:hypothetical protein
LSSTLIPDQYAQTKSDVKQAMTKAQACAVTTDMWTASNNEQYMGVTAHFISNDFHISNRCVAVKHVPGTHTAEVIANELTTVLKDFDMTQQTSSRPLFIVTDSGANVKKGISLMKDVSWRPCFAHKLQLVVNGGLNHPSVRGISTMLAQARSIVGYFRRSPLACSQLVEQQREANKPQHKLLQDVETRWNSQVSLHDIY